MLVDVCVQELHVRQRRDAVPLLQTCSARSEKKSEALRGRMADGSPRLMGEMGVEALAANDDAHKRTSFTAQLEAQHVVVGSLETHSNHLDLGRAQRREESLQADMQGVEMSR